MRLSRMDVSSLDALLDMGIHLFHGARRLNRHDLSLLLKRMHDRHTSINKHPEPLPNRFSIIVVAARSLTPLHQALLHHILGAVEEERELRQTDRLLEEDRLVQFPGEPINQKPGLLARRCRALLLQGVGHGVRKQRHGDLHGHNGALANVGLDQIAVLASGAGLLGAQQVAGREVGETVVADEVGGLGSLSASRAAEEEDDGDVGGGEARSGIRGGLWRGGSGGHGASFGVGVGHFFYFLFAFLAYCFCLLFRGARDFALGRLSTGA